MPPVEDYAEVCRVPCKEHLEWVSDMLSNFVRTVFIYIHVAHGWFVGTAVMHAAMVHHAL